MYYLLIFHNGTFAASRNPKRLLEYQERHFSRARGSRFLGKEVAIEKNGFRGNETGMLWDRDAASGTSPTSECRAKRR